MKLKQTWQKIRIHIFVCLTGVLLTTLLTWPFAENLNSYYTDSGDYVGMGSTLWWSFESLVSGRIFDYQKYFNGFQLYPMPYSFAVNDHLVIPTLIFGIFYAFTQNFVFSLNLLTFSGLLLTFISGFYVINFLIKNVYAAIIGAFIFTFNPITFAQFPQHALFLYRFFLPPLFLYAYKFFKFPNFKDAFFLGLFFTLNALSVIYFQIYSIFLLGVLALIYILINLFSKNFGYPLRVIKYSLITLVFLPLLLYFNLPYLQFNGLEGAKRSIEQNIYYSGRVADWFTPSRSSLLYGGLGYAVNDKRENLEKQDNYYHEEHSLFLNFTPIFLFLGALVYFLGNRKTKLKRFFSLYLSSPLPLFLTVLGISFIMTFGPYFTGWNGDTGTIKLPFYFFYEYLPFGKGVRVPPRFQFIFYLPFALFCAYGALFLFNKTKRYFFAAFLILLTLLAVENINVFSFDKRSYILPKVERLSQNGQLGFLKEKNVLHLPIIFPDFIVTEGVYHNWRVVTGERIVNMHSGYTPQDQANLLLKLKEGVGSDELRQLSVMGVDFVVIHNDLISPDLYESTFSQYDEIYSKGIVFDKEDTRIIDLKKYDFKFNVCDFNKDMNFTLNEAVITGTRDRTKVVTIKNKSDCFLPNIYRDRYRQIDVYQNFIKSTVYLRMPLLIEPFGEVTLSEINNEVRFK